MKALVTGAPLQVKPCRDQASLARAHESLGTDSLPAKKDPGGHAMATTGMVRFLQLHPVTMAHSN